jgi:hypothetical protein
MDRPVPPAISKSNGDCRCWRSVSRDVFSCLLVAAGRPMFARAAQSAPRSSSVPPHGAPPRL